MLAAPRTDVVPPETMPPNHHRPKSTTHTGTKEDSKAATTPITRPSRTPCRAISLARAVST